MKFGKEFDKSKVPEWIDAYMDYDGLKQILREIMLYKLSKQTPKHLRTLEQRATLHQTFSGLLAQSSSRNNNVDIEDHVISVSTLQNDGSGKLYETCFLKQSEGGGEIEVMFFRKLDEELNKVSTFYKGKVEAVMSEASELHKQMDALVALRIMVDKKYSSGNNATTQSNSPDRAGTLDAGVGDTMVSEVEISDTSLSERNLGSQSGNGKSNNFQEGGESIPGQDSKSLPNINRTIDGRQDEQIKKFKEDSLQILQRVKINNRLETPRSTIKGVLRDFKDDELRFGKEELRKVQEQLRLVFIEYFQKLRLLKHYSFMNLTAFSKILKKYDKIASRRVTRSYMKVVDNSYLGSDEINILLERVEATFIKHFSDSNRKEGMKMLRPKAKREKHRVTFLSGFFSGCSIALIVAIVLRTEAIERPEKQEGTSYVVDIFPLYSLLAFVVLHMFMYGVDIYFWRRYRVNYPFIFGFKQGTELGYREVFLISTGLAVLALANFLVNLHLDLNLRTKHYQKLTQIIPLVSITVVIAILVCPFNIIYRSSRFFFFRSLFRSVCAPLYKVTLPDFILADNLTSQIQVIRTIELYICYYCLGDFPHSKSKCHSHGVYNAFYFIVAIIPYWLRFLQCLRRLFEEKEKVHGYNGLKYLLIIVAVLLRTTYELKKGTTWLVLALMSSALAAIMSTYWDLVMDWGLLRRNSRNLFLRDKLLVSHKSIYFAAMAFNIVLRVAWMQLVLGFNLHALDKMALTTTISCLEIIRRGIWNFFRLENEHLNNVGKYRAFKSVPLPFNYYDDETDKDD